MGLHHQARVQTWEDIYPFFLCTESGNWVEYQAPSAWGLSNLDPQSKNSPEFASRVKCGLSARNPIPTALINMLHTLKRAVLVFNQKDCTPTCL